MRLFILITILTVMPKETLFNFNTTLYISHWRTVDDVVMGGRSSGNFTINDEGQIRVNLIIE